MTLFVPNPDAGSVEDLIEELAVELARTYRDVEDTLIREIATRAVKDLRLSAQLDTADARERNRLLAELAAHRAVSARELQSEAVALVERVRRSGLAADMIATAAREGEAAAVARMGLAASTGTIVGTAAQATAMVALSLQSRLEVLNQRITRYPRDAYQRITALYSPQTILGVSTSRQQQAAAVQRFLAEGIPGFVDRSGRRWTIGAYAEMAGRTSVNRAYNDAGIWRMQQAGLNLVTVVRGLDSCRKCAEWSGKILSTDGTTGTVTLPASTGSDDVTVQVDGTVDGARAAGWGHPNCRCRLVAYSPGLSIPQASTTYNPEAEKERAKQRELERDIRAAKRREAAAMTDTDRAKAARDVRDAQAEMRQFIASTGRKRQSYREQLGFADGRTIR